jgi:hypothetical protein
LHRRRKQRLLNGVFGGGEVMEASSYRPENLWRKFAQQTLGGGV